MKKQRFRSLLCLVLAVLMLISVAGCTQETIPPLENGDEEKNNTILDDDIFSDEDDEENEDENNDESSVQIPSFTVENLKNAKIVYPANVYAPGGQVETAIDSLISSIKPKFSFELEKNTDKKNNGELEYEILIGDTNREESLETLTDLLQGDYGYKINGTKIVIKGGSQEALVQAIKDFQSKVVVARHDKDVFYDSSLDAITRQNRAGKDLLINGTPISEFTIVYPNKGSAFEEDLALRLSDYIAMLSGHVLTYQADSAAQTEHEILIGKTKRSFTVLTQSGAAVESDANHVAIVGDTAYDLGLAQDAFSELLKAAAVDKVPLTLLDKTPVSATEKIKIMSYNVYGFDHYGSRCINIRRLVTKYLPDIIGYQEPDVAMTNKIRMSDYYEWFDGKGRHDKPDGTTVSDTGGGANSISPIGYAKDRYEFILGDTKWSTGTPDYPSKNQTIACHYRMYTYAMLRDKLTGEEFIIVNHHLQGAIGTEQLTYAFKFFHENYTDVPVIMLGDYNSVASDEAIARVMIEDGGFTSLHSMVNNPESNSPASIDWVFAMSCCVKGTYYKCCSETYPDKQARPNDTFGDGKWPSDHRPVYVELIIKSDREEHTHDWSKLASEAEWITQPTVPERQT